MLERSTEDMPDVEMDMELDQELKEMKEEREEHKKGEKGKKGEKVKKEFGTSGAQQDQGKGGGRDKVKE